MRPAARLTDLTIHGGLVLPPCSPNVLFNGLPAARMSDLHACPIPPPHLPLSPFLVGSSKVLINGLPALRMGDPCACGASVAVGSPTILIAD